MKKLIIELNEEFSSNKIINPFQLAKHDSNSNIKQIFVTKNFSILNSHKSFLQFTDIWPDTNKIKEEIES